MHDEVEKTNNEKKKKKKASTQIVKCCLNPVVPYLVNFCYMAGKKKRKIKTLCCFLLPVVQFWDTRERGEDTAGAGQSNMAARRHNVQRFNPSKASFY